MRYKAVLFDMDGTVLDTVDDLADSVNASLRQYSLPEVSRAHVVQTLGNGAAYLIRRSLPEGCSEELYEQVLAFYKPWYKAHCRIKTKPYPGILPLMEALRSGGIRQAIISNKPDPAVQELAEVFFPGLLDVVVGESPEIRRKPSPDMFFAAVSRMGLEVSDCVYIGDTEVDIETARTAGMDCISVTWGFRPEEQLIAAGAAELVHTPSELEALLLS
ncbi:MAG: HAD-IA family hydrolase [Oscillospiraceae bacterium]|nr:HAD-IA family hydrolase [Oscillospiraceae bacterium]MBO7373734.1 HAD-IA family hydrolase [Oscillospiraceae bacterium]MBP5240201.1 HAD-IA family hydrolase [Oscillospiraceae bacterium]